MNGYLITFYTEQNRRHQGKQIHEWLLHLAINMNLRGATVSTGVEGLDHRGHFHSANFFELADQPVQVQFALTNEETEQLFQRLKEENLSLFYVKTAVEFGTLGNSEEHNT